MLYRNSYPYIIFVKTERNIIGLYYSCSVLTKIYKRTDLNIYVKSVQNVLRISNYQKCIFIRKYIFVPTAIHGKIMLSRALVKYSRTSNHVWAGALLKCKSLFGFFHKSWCPLMDCFKQIMPTCQLFLIDRTTLRLRDPWCAIVLQSKKTTKRYAVRYFWTGKIQ